MKQINGRFAQKIDSEVNWNKAINFIPMAGEIIIYKKDSNYNYDRIKIGDGLTTVVNLPFTVLQSDWVQTDSTKSDYIKNKPDFKGLEARIVELSAYIDSYLLNINYDETLAFDTSEIIFGTTTNTSAILGRAILGQMVLA